MAKLEQTIRGKQISSSIASVRANQVNMECQELIQVGRPAALSKIYNAC